MRDSKRSSRHRLSSAHPSRLPIAGILLLAALLAAGAVQGAPVTALAFSLDGSELVSAGQGTVDVRSVEDGQVLRRIRTDLPKIRALAFHPHAGLLAVAGGAPGVSGEILLLEWPEGTVRHRQGGFADVATTVAFSKDGMWLGGGSADHRGRVWTMDGERHELSMAYELKGHAGAVLTIAFSSTGRTVLTAGADRALKVWSREHGGLIRSLNYHTEPVHTIAFRPWKEEEADQPPEVVCASGSEDRTVRVWQPEVGRMVRIVRGHQGAVFAVVFAADGRRLFSAGEEGIIRCIDAGSDRILKAWRAHDDWVYALAVSPNGGRLASGDWSGEVRVWDGP